MGGHGSSGRGGSSGTPSAKSINTVNTFIGFYKRNRYRLINRLCLSHFAGQNIGNATPRSGKAM